MKALTTDHIDRRTALGLGTSLLLGTVMPAIAIGEETAPDIVGIHCLVHQLRGAPIAGTVSEIDESHVTLERDGVSKKLSLESVLLIEMLNPPAKVKGFSSCVTLIDGSKLLIKEAILTDKEFRLTPLEDGASITVDRKRSGTRSIQLAEIPKSALSSWMTLESRREKAQDALVIYNTDKGSIDWIDGYVSNIDERTVTFHLDDERYEVARVRKDKVIAGVYFADFRSEKLPEKCGLLTTVNGGSLAFSELSIKGDNARITGVSGITLQVPLDSVKTIDFSPGKVFSIDSLSVANVDYSKDATGTFERLQRPALNQSALGGPLKIGREIYAGGLSLQSGTSITFRLPSAVTEFRATAGIDPAIQTDASVVFRIVGQSRDGTREIARYKISTGDDPIVLNADITEMHRLQLIVEPGPDLAFGDILNLANAEVRR